MPCPWTSRTRSSSRPTCAPRSSTFEIWHPTQCLSSSAITRPLARSVASSEVCRGRRWRDSCTPSSPKVSGRLSCGDSCPRSGQVRCMLLQRVGLSLLSANADLIRAHLANALRDPAQLVTAAGTVALTVSASLLVTFSAPRSHDRPEPVPLPAPTVERAQQHPVVALVTFCANSRAQSLQERGRTRRPTRTEPQ